MRQWVNLLSKQDEYSLHCAYMHALAEFPHARVHGNDLFLIVSFELEMVKIWTLKVYYMCIDDVTYHHFPYLAI